MQKVCTAGGACQYNCIGACAPVPPGGGTGGGGGGGGGCDPNQWTPWTTTCVGSPATQNRQNQCGTVEYRNCTGSILARAVIVNPSDTSCPTIKASTTPLTGTVHQFSAGSASQPAAQTQTGASYVTFSTIVGGTYTLASVSGGNYAVQRACWVKAVNTPTSGEGLTTTLSIPTNADTLTWDIGYTPTGAWTQAQDGNVLANGIITSFIPAVSPRVFAKDGAGGYPGIVGYNTSYDFDPGVGKGETLVSSTNWLVKQPTSVIDWYTYFYSKLGGPQTVDSFADLTAVTRPASRTKPYYVVGDMTTSGDWAVGDGESIVFLINGNLTIGGKINMTGTGFVAFIVKGNITVSSNAGGLYTSSTPVVEGLYMTSPTGIFKTGTSSVVGKERLVLKGTFVAGNFTLERDLNSVNANTSAPAELFIYNSALSILMPDSLRDVPITWQEVAP
ncbi:hypothetical protein HY086_02930 [Candidatus Gottesmanbacteria bacterium]|nr:hypothetical protein [Candidatus Gottesmanbacteria bacterium]